MSADEHTPPKVQETVHLVEEGKWFRPAGKGFWHLEAHKEYGVVWSLCGVRMRVAQAETRGELDQEAGQMPCANCQFKERQNARKRGD